MGRLTENPMSPTLRRLRDHQFTPHYFGLGFIQVKITEARRVHFWVPEWPTIPGAEDEWHDHRYPFTSWVLHGAVAHEVGVLGHVHERPFPHTDELVHVSCQPGQSAEPDVVGYGRILPVARFTVGAGQSYALDSDTFHRARAAGHTITLVERGPVERPFARVVRPLGVGSVCPFSLGAGRDCWSMIDSMLADVPDDVLDRPLVPRISA